MKKTIAAFAALAAINLFAVPASERYVDEATNATLRAAKAYTDAHGGSEGVDTNAVREIVRPMIGAAIAANEKTGTAEQIVRGNYNEDDYESETWEITTLYSWHAQNAEEANGAERDFEHNIITETYARKDEIAATNPTFSNAVMGVASHTNADFAAEVLAVQVASLSTNITEEAYIAATNACANLGIDPALIPGEGTVGTVGGFIAMLFAVVFWMRKKIFDNSGKVNDTFAGELMGKPVAKEKVQDIIADDVTPATDPALTKTIATIGGKAIKAPEGGGGDTTFCLKYDPENDVLYYDDGEPEENA